MKNKGGITRDEYLFLVSAFLTSFSTVMIIWVPVERDGLSNG